MADADRTIVRAEFGDDQSGPNGPGVYYTMIDDEGNTSEPVGPYENMKAAEAAFMAAMEEAAIEMIKQNLGLKDLS